MTTCIFTLGSVISESSLGVVTPPQKFLVPVQRSLLFLPGMEYSEGGGTAVEEGQKYVRQRFSVAWAGKVIRAPCSSFLLPLSPSLLEWCGRSVHCFWYTLLLSLWLVLHTGQ